MIANYNSMSILRVPLSGGCNACFCLGPAGPHKMAASHVTQRQCAGQYCEGRRPTLKVGEGGGYYNYGLLYEGGGGSGEGSPLDIEV